MAGKVAIIGAGNVGTATAFAVAMDGTPDEVVLFDCNLKKAEGEVMDIEHASTFIPHTHFHATQEYADLADADVVVITAGAKQAPGDTRLDLVDKNIDILSSILEQVVPVAPNAVLLLVANPVDVLTYAAHQMSGFPAERVIGTGTVLDTVRFRSFIADEFDVNPKNVHAYIMGEHGNSSFPVLSNASIGAIPMNKMPGYDKKRMTEIHEDVVQAAYEVIDRKGATNLAIGVCVAKLLHVMLNDTEEILPVSTVLDGEYGLEGLAISTPCMIGREGITRRFELPLNAQETKGLQKSAKVLKEVIKQQEAREKNTAAWCPVD